jgi:hypothetical protein
LEKRKSGGHGCSCRSLSNHQRRGGCSAKARRVLGEAAWRGRAATPRTARAPCSALRGHPHRTPQSKMVLRPAGSFLEMVAHCIRRTRSGVSTGSPSAIGLTFGGGSVYGWVEFNLGETGVNRVADIRRVDFGVTEDLLKSGMKQEVRVERDVLFRLGELLGDIPLGPHGGSDLRPTSSTSSETTTPATGGAGPASVVKSSKLTKANQPSGNSGDLAGALSRPHQQDSDEKKRGQSPHPFSSHGSPSSDRSNQRKDEPLWSR